MMRRALLPLSCLFVALIAACGSDSGSADDATATPRDADGGATGVEVTPQADESGSTPESAATTYTVQPGDTLGQIARQFEVSVEELARENGIENPDLISVGRELTIPGSE